MGTAENKRSVMVGIFVLVAIIIFVAGIFILGGKQKRFVKSINVTAVFGNVSGLKVGNNVWYSGVKIGTVKKIVFSGDNQVEISLTIEEDAQKYIHKDAKARLGSESLIGNKIVEIIGGSPQAPSVEDGDRIHTAIALNTDDIMETLQENNKNLVAITTDFKTLSSKLVKGEGLAGTLLSDTTMANNFRSIVTSLQQASATTARVSGSLAQFTTKLNTKDGLANKLLTDTVVFNQLKGSVVQLRQTTTSAAEMTNNLKQASTKLENNNNALGVMLNDEAFATKLKTTMGNLETSTAKLDENMEALQHNFLLRGFFRKRAKNEAKQKAAEEKK